MHTSSATDQSYSAGPSRAGGRSHRQGDAPGDRRARALLLHVAVPLLGILAIVALYFTPVSAIGCANRGLAAMAVAAATGVAAVATGWKASRASRDGDSSAGWWLASTVILLLPVLLLTWPLG